ncbi:MAG: twin-arginine translocation signal domain-containing protein [Desulfotalea sp.]
MHEERRSFLKSTLSAGAVGVGAFLVAKPSFAKDEAPSSSNGVVQGFSPKKEVLYKKTQAWDIYYKAAY